jgi:hypothetical protein
LPDKGKALSSGKLLLMRKNRLLSVVCLFIFFSLSLPSYSQEKNLEGKKIVPAKSSTINFLALSKLPQKPEDLDEKEIEVDNVLAPPENESILSSTRNSVTPVYSHEFRTLVASPSPTLSYLGLPDAVAVGTGSSFIPPDTHGAIGPDKVMVTLNNNVAILNKATGAAISTVSLSSFWSSTGATGIFDPKITYDLINNRWIFVATANASSASSSICVGVSQTSDPTGAWNLTRYIVGFTNGSSQIIWADFPCLGFNKNWIAVSVNMFNASTNAGVEGRMIVVNYPSIRSGVHAGTLFTAIGTGGFCLSPALTYSPYQDTLFCVSHIGSAAASYILSTITGTSASPALTIGSTKTNSLGGWTQPGNDILPQAVEVTPGTGTAKLNCQDAFVRSNTIYRDGYIYYAQTVGLPAGGLTHTAVQWTKVNTAGTFVEGGRVEDPTATTASGFWYCYPSIDVNLFGDVLLGFSQFSATQAPAAGYTFHSRSDAAGTMRDPVIFKAGEGYYNKTFGGGRNRWGDYSTTQFDPADNYNIWTLQEYSRTPVGNGDGSGRWGTWWAKVTPVLAPGTLYRSVQNGNWGTTASWQSSSGDNVWSAAGSTPTSTSYGNTILNGHIITVTANVNTDQTVINAGGTLVINSGQTLTIDNGPEDDIVNSGLLNVNGTVTNNGSISGGTVSGTGTITGTAFTNKGTVAPGNSAGKLTLSGTYTQTSAGVLNIEIGGTTVSTQYDQLSVGGASTLGGTLNVALIGGFTPSIGNTFTILDAASLSGTFATVNLPAGYTWTTNYDAPTGNVILSVTGILPVNLLSFNANIQSQNVLLSWKTAEEVNHDRFEVERSTDGKQFTKIGTVSGQTGTATIKYYSLTDIDAVQVFQSVGKIYYRLKIVGKNGENSYSLIVPVTFNKGKNFNVTISPNPFSSHIDVNLYLPANGKVSAKLVDASGRTVNSYEADLQKGFNSFIVGSLDQLATGTYTLQVVCNGQSVTKQLLKSIQ